MMKKVLLLFVTMSLVACTSTIEIVDEGKRTPSSTDQELTLKTIADPTRAIAEGTDVPRDNFIGFMPNFHSDIAGVDFSDYNRISRFGFDWNTGAWRGMAEGVAKEEEDQGLSRSLMDDYQKRYFVISPFYWPGAERVSLDYVSYSYNNILDVLLSTLRNGYGLGSVISPAIQSYIDMVLAAIPQKYNANRMNLWYQNKVHNLLGYALVYSFLEGECPIVHPYSVGVVLVLSAMIDDVETLGMKDKITPRDIDELLDILMASGEERKELETFENTEVFAKVKGAVEFIRDYYKAYEIITHKTTFVDSGLTGARFNEVVNQAYWFFMNNLSKVSKYIQDDLMYAYDRNLKNTNGGTIQAKYNHAKAWVKVVVNNVSQDKDILVTGIAFENVKTGGSLVIDNSKTSFETYWDFDATQPEHGTPESSGSMMIFDPYAPVTLDGESVATRAANKEVRSQERRYAKILDQVQELFVTDTVFIPDAYFVPAGCYGPALSITHHGASVLPDVPAEPVISDTPAPDPVPAPIAEEEIVGGEGYRYLTYTYLNGTSPFETRVADNVGGSMFPAQESGKINILYYSWDSNNLWSGHGSDGHEKTYDYNMLDLLEYCDDNSETITLHSVSLNLPRRNWQMGKLYIYLVSIADDEIIIDGCIEKDWDETFVTPSYGPEIPSTTQRLYFDVDPDWGWN